MEHRRLSLFVLVISWSLLMGGRQCHAYRRYGCLTAIFDWWRCSPWVTWSGGYIIYTCEGRCRARNGARSGQCVLENVCALTRSPVYICKCVF